MIDKNEDQESAKEFQNCYKGKGRIDKHLRARDFEGRTVTYNGKKYIVVKDWSGFGRFEYSFKRIRTDREKMFGTCLQIAAALMFVGLIASGITCSCVARHNREIKACSFSSKNHHYIAEFETIGGDSYTAYLESNGEWILDNGKRARDELWDLTRHDLDDRFKSYSRKKAADKVFSKKPEQEVNKNVRNQRNRPFKQQSPQRVSRRRGQKLYQGHS